MANIVPDDDLPGAEGDGAPELKATPRAGVGMQKTIADIEAGKPAPKATWKGQPMPEYKPGKLVPTDDLAVPEDDLPESVPVKGKGFLDTLRNPMDLWRNESIIGNLYDAQQKGVFNKPWGELVKESKEEISKFSVGQMWDAAVQNPGAFLGEVVNGIVADPELLLIPIVGAARLGATATKASLAVAKAANLGAKATAATVKAGQIAAGAVAGAATGAATMAPVAMAKQLDEAGVIDPRQVIEDMKGGAAMGAAFGVMFNAAGSSLKKKPSAIYDDFKAKTEKGMDPVEAMDTTLKNFGMKESDRQAYTKVAKEQVDVAAGNAADDAARAKAEGKSIEPEAPKVEVKGEEVKIEPIQARSTTDLLSSLYPEEVKLGATQTADDLIARRAQRQAAEGITPKTPTPLRERLEQRELPPQAKPAEAEQLIQQLNRLEAQKRPPVSENVRREQVARAYAKSEEAQWGELAKAYQERVGKKEAEAAATLSKEGKLDPEAAKYFAEVLGAGALGAGATYAVTGDSEKAAFGALAGMGLVIGGKALKLELQRRGFESPEMATLAALDSTPMRRIDQRFVDKYPEFTGMRGEMTKLRLDQFAKAYTDLNNTFRALEGKGASSGRAIFDLISKNSPDEVQVQVANLLKGKLRDVSVVVDDLVLDKYRAKFGQNIDGIYDPFLQKIIVSPMTDVPRVLNHEGIHASVMLHMHAQPNSPASMMMRRLYGGVRKIAEKHGITERQHYGLTNVDEFVAEAFSQPKFQEILRSIPVKELDVESFMAMLDKPKTAWDAFTQGVRRIISRGKEKTPPNDTLSLALEIGAEIINKEGGHAQRNKAWRELVATGRLGDQVAPSRGLGAEEGGAIDPKLLKVLGLAGLAAGIGSYMADDPKDGAVIGAALALGGVAARRASQVVYQNMRNKLTNTILKQDTSYRLDGMRHQYQSTLAGMKIDVARVGEALKQLVKNPARREELTHYIDSGKQEFAPKTADERQYVDLLNNTFRTLGEAGQQAGVLESLIKEGSYITHLYGVKGEDLNKAKIIFSNMNPNSRFANKREFPTLQVAMENGMKPLTLDGAEIVRIYGESLAKSIATSQFVKGLKVAQHPDGRGLVVKSADAPPEYVGINHPQLQWAKVHPEVAPSLKLLFSVDEPNAVSQAMLEFSAIAKRSLFSFSMFHGMALTEAMVAGQGGLLKGISNTGRGLYRVVRNKSWLEGEFGKNAEEAAKAGVVLEPHSGIDAQSDILQAMLKRTLDNSEGWLSSGRLKLAAAGAGLGALYAEDGSRLEGGLAAAALLYGGGRVGMKAAKHLDGMLNEVLWNRIHPTFKILTFKTWQEKLLRENAVKAEQGKPTLTPDEINQAAASYTNDIFGGQNWVELAEGVNNYYGRKIMMALASPAGRRGMSIGMLAPDWTASTIRSITKAIPGVSNATIGRMHRSYVMNSALMYLTFGDMLTYNLSGKHLWELDDPTFIDLGDGRKMQLNKHFMETFHWIQHPGKVMANKAGSIPRIVGKVLFDPYTKDPEKIAKEIVGSMTPIPVANLATQGEFGTSTVAGIMGLPIYGKTYKEQAIAAAEKKAKMKQKKMTPEEEAKKLQKRWGR